MWPALSKAGGEIVVFGDADTRNFRADLVVGIADCLLVRPEIRLIKAAYRRPFADGELSIPDGGGRVAELLAKPLLNVFFPELAGFVQPMAGEFGGRELLCSLPFLTGYAVEIGLLIDVFGACGLASMAQVALDVQLNRHQDLPTLSRMAYSIQRAVLIRATGTGQPGCAERFGPAEALNEISTYVYAVARTDGLAMERYGEVLIERPPMGSVLGDRPSQLWLVSSQIVTILLTERYDSRTSHTDLAARMGS